LGILFSSILCKCPNQRNLYSLIVSYVTVNRILVIGPSILVHIFRKPTNALQWPRYCDVRRSHMFRLTNTIRKLIWSSQATYMSVFIAGRIMEFRVN
jgi:hypothetical protein